MSAITPQKMAQDILKIMDDVALQNRELARINLAGGRAFIINESNVEGLETLLRSKQ